MTPDEARDSRQPESEGRVALQRLVRQTWETFDKRAATWAREEGELGSIVDVEIRTLNTTWLEVAEKLTDADDNEWLDAIGTQWMKLTGRPWETRDGETASEGREANIGALFARLEELVETMRTIRDYYGGAGYIGGLAGDALSSYDRLPNARSERRD